MCGPNDRPVYSFGDVQAANAALSSEHSKLEPCSLPEKLNVALVLRVVAGGAPEPIVVSGAAVSMVQLWVAGDWSVLPAASVARTRNTWSPAERPVYCLGEVHGKYAPLSIEQANVEPASSAVKSKVALTLLVVAAGAPAPIVVCGGVPSLTRQLNLAGVGSTLPSASTARTSNVWSPTARPL